jgi:hypothetical protein
MIEQILAPLSSLVLRTCFAAPQPMDRPRTTRAVFAHRRNDDGTVDSICPTCFQTIAHTIREPDLQYVEDGRVCNPFLLEHYRQLSEEAKYH